MHSLPDIAHRSDYEAIRADGDRWLRVMQVICQRHGLPADRLARFGNSEDPEFGSMVVFAAGEEHVIKLYPPLYHALFDADSTVGKYVYGKIGITTPQIQVEGMLDGWPYLVMSRLWGTTLADIWDTLEHTNQLQIVAALAETIRSIHTLPVTDLPLLDANWSAWVDNRVRNCVQRHREQGVPEDWQQQIPAFLTRAQPLYPADFTPAIVSGDIHQYHLFAAQPSDKQWRLCGLFDFDDSLIGFHEYDLAATSLFLMAGRPALLHTFFLTYGYAPEALNEQLSYRLMAYTLLHRYRPFNWVREAFARRPCETIEQLALALYPFA